MRSSPLSFGIALFILTGGIFWMIGPLPAVGFFFVFGLLGSFVIARR